MKVTQYFEHMRMRADRAIIKDEWIARAIRTRPKRKFNPVGGWESGHDPEKTRVALDSKGNLVSMTIEHARKNARLQEFSFEEVQGQPFENGRTMA